MSEDRLLNTQQVLNRLKVSRSTLYALMEQGRLKPMDKPAFLTKHPRLMFRESDVERLLSGEKSDDDKEAHTRKAHVAA